MRYEKASLADRIRKIQELKLQCDIAGDFPQNNLSPQDVLQKLPTPSQEGMAKILESTAQGSFYEDVNRLGEGNLTFESEQALFWSLNYCKWQAGNLRDQLPREIPGSPTYLALVAQIEDYWQAVDRIRTRIVNANARAVIRAGRETGQGRNLDVYASYGNEALLKAIDGFEFTRGLRFSTYLHKALYVWAVVRMRRDDFESRQGGLTNVKENFVESLSKDQSNIPEVEDEEVRQEIVNILSQLFAEAQLSDREVDMIMRKFGIEKFNEHTLMEVGQAHGVTRERVRQIIDRSLRRLAQIARQKELDTLF